MSNRVGVMESWNSGERKGRCKRKTDGIKSKVYGLDSGVQVS